MNGTQLLDTLYRHGVVTEREVWLAFVHLRFEIPKSELFASFIRKMGEFLKRNS